MPAKAIAALVAALALGALGLAGCGREQAAEATPDAEAREQAAEARERAAAAQGAVEDLEELTEDLEQRVADAERGRARLETKLDNISKRLWESLGSARASLDEVREESGSALSQVSTALAEARSAARDLTILENRFDYHLRRDHGGG